MKFTDYCILSDDVIKVAKFYTELFQANTEFNNIHAPDGNMIVFRSWK